MNFNLRYRARQFWQSLRKPPTREDWKRIEGLLEPSELELFQRLLVPDQNHSLRVLDSLAGEGETDSDLLKTALLHDIGKTVYPLRRWERVYAVLMGSFFPGVSAAWGKLEPKGLYRPLVIIHQHPAWGAELAEKAGCSPRVVWLIRHHEVENLTGLLDDGRVELLIKLQKADNSN